MGYLYLDSYKCSILYLMHFPGRHETVTKSFALRSVLCDVAASLPLLSNAFSIFLMPVLHCYLSLSLCLFVLSLCLSLSLSLSLSVSLVLFLCLSVSFSFCLSLSFSLSLSVCLSPSPSLMLSDQISSVDLECAGVKANSRPY